jgi:hypothetical protein
MCCLSDCPAGLLVQASHAAVSAAHAELEGCSTKFVLAQLTTRHSVTHDVILLPSVLLRFFIHSD